MIDPLSFGRIDEFLYKWHTDNGYIVVANKLDSGSWLVDTYYESKEGMQQVNAKISHSLMDAYRTVRQTQSEDN
jgi:hypothetical protein